MWGMKIGVCDYNAVQLGKTIELIWEHIGDSDEYEVVAYSANQLIFDVEDQVFDCDIIVMKLEYNYYWQD